LAPGISSPSSSSSASQRIFWCNINHALLGKDHELLPFWFRTASGEQRHATWSELFAILAAYWSEATFFEWRLGDMLVLDNQLVAHNASPGMGPRSIMPVFGDCFTDDGES